MPGSRAHGLTLWLLTILFLARVTGQVVVATLGPSFLPPMAAWQSGLLPDPLLLTSQLAILAAQARINTHVLAGTGVLRARTGRLLVGLAAAYFTAMVLRYALTMALHPERRWLGGTIPIVFHFVLAAYLFVLGRFHTRTAESAA
jgi:hypothetical protein